MRLRGENVGLHLEQAEAVVCVFRASFHRLGAAEGESLNLSVLVAITFKSLVNIKDGRLEWKWSK